MTDGMQRHVCVWHLSALPLTVTGPPVSCSRGSSCPLRLLVLQTSTRNLLLPFHSGSSASKV